MPADSFSRMNSSGSDNDADKIPTPSFIRIRTESEGSTDRTPKFILPGVAGSPPKVLTMDEVQNVIKSVDNMTLAHEIAINPEFRLQPYEPPENSLEKNIKDMLHNAFWEILREQLSSDPPIYDHAIQLLGEIKEDFTHIITKNNVKALERIMEVLDETIIRQQAEEGVLDFKSYVDFIIRIMAKSCAPVRDEKLAKLAKLSEIDDPVNVFRGIFETMALMKLDMANCILQAARREVIANSIEYEKGKFQEYLNVYKYGFPATEAWLHRHKPIETTNKHWQDIAILNAYVELLQWNAENEFPELILMDKDRLMEIAAKSLRLCAAASVLAIAHSHPTIGQNIVAKKALASEIIILLESVHTNKDLENVIDSIWLHIKTVINKYLKEKSLDEMDEKTENALRTPIKQIAKIDSPVRTLMWNRLEAYVRITQTCKLTPPPPPPGYIDFENELKIFMAFKSITFYNYTVFGEQYHQMLNQECVTASSTAATSNTSDNNQKNSTSSNEPTTSAAAVAASDTSSNKATE